MRLRKRLHTTFSHLCCWVWLPVCRQAGSSAWQQVLNKNIQYKLFESRHGRNDFENRTESFSPTKPPFVICLFRMNCCFSIFRQFCLSRPPCYCLMFLNPRQKSYTHTASNLTQKVHRILPAFRMITKALLLAIPAYILNLLK